MQSGSCGKNLTWTLDDYGTLTISGTGEMENYDDDKTAPWFNKQESIKKVIIDDGVTTIGDSAFYGYDLTSVIIGNSVTTIGEWAFCECENLTSVTIGNNVTTIGFLAFHKCENLTSVIIGNNVRTIGHNAFSCCNNLASVIIPDSVKTIGHGAFCECENLKSVTIGNSVKTIGKYAFSWCDLTSVKIPDSVTTIFEKVFDGCTSLKEIHYPAGRGFEKNLSQGNNAKLIPYTVAPPITQSTAQSGNELKFYPVQPTKQPPKFYPAQPTKKPVAEKLMWKFEGKTLTVGGVREIENFPYAQIPWVDHLCDIQRIIIGNGVEKISARAFDDCTRLEILELPASVKTIGDMAFSVSFCGSINGVKNVFWCLEDGVLILKKNPDAPPAADFSTGSVSWIFAEKNIRSIKIEDGVKPTEKFFSWLTQRFNGKEISFK